MADDLTKRVFDQGWMQDVESDWAKCKIIMARQRQLYTTLLAVLNHKDIKSAIGIVEDVIMCHVALRELWGIEDKDG